MMTVMLLVMVMMMMMMMMVVTMSFVSASVLITEDCVDVNDFLGRRWRLKLGLLWQTLCCLHFAELNVLRLFKQQASRILV